VFTLRPVTLGDHVRTVLLAIDVGASLDSRRLILSLCGIGIIVEALLADGVTDGGDARIALEQVDLARIIRV
jgi:hypothetical protein